VFEVLSLEDKNILVTGGAGFIGSALTRELLKEKANVIVYDNFIYGDQGNIIELGDDIRIIIGDILSWKLQDTMKRFHIDYVFHLAAEPYIPHCYDNPEKFINVNIIGTMNVLMAAKLFDVEKIIHFSSSEVYGTSKYSPMDEKHPTLPLSTYAVSKLSADRICYVWAKEHNIPVVIMRPFNSYGPCETQPYVIPEIIMQLAKSNTVKLGNIKAERDFTYVDDTVRGAIGLLTNDIPIGKVINIGSGCSTSIEALAHQIGYAFGYDVIEIIIDKSRLRPIDVDVLKCDYSQINSLTGWEPTISLRDGLKKTIDWFMNNNARWLWEGRVEGNYYGSP